MRVEPVEIFSDKTNSAVLRHPGRRFPGVLIQGDSLCTLCLDADRVCDAMGRGAPGYADANRLRNALWSFLSHYRTTLTDHAIPLPFSEQPRL